MANWRIQCLDDHETTILADEVVTDAEHQVLIGSRGGVVVFIAPLGSVLYARQTEPASP